MKTKQKIVIIVSLVIAVVLTAGGTILLLKQLGVGRQSGDAQSKTKDATELSREAAETLSKEASELLESDPAQAQAKYLEAEKAYTSANDSQKAAEMLESATKARDSVPIPPPATGGKQ